MSEPIVARPEALSAACTSAAMLSRFRSASTWPSVTKGTAGVGDGAAGVVSSQLPMLAGLPGLPSTGVGDLEGGLEGSEPADEEPERICPRISFIKFLISAFSALSSLIAGST